MEHRVLCSSETWIASAQRWRVQQTFNWLAGRVRVPCLKLPDFLICNTPGSQSFFFSSSPWLSSSISPSTSSFALNSRRNWRRKCSAYLLELENKLSVRAVIVNCVFGPRLDSLVQYTLAQWIPHRRTVGVAKVSNVAKLLTPPDVSYEFLIGTKSKARPRHTHPFVGVLIGRVSLVF